MRPLVPCTTKLLGAAQYNPTAAATSVFAHAMCVWLGQTTRVPITQPTLQTTAQLRQPTLPSPCTQWPCQWRLTLPTQSTIRSPCNQQVLCTVTLLLLPRSALSLDQHCHSISATECSRIVTVSPLLYSLHLLCFVAATYAPALLVLVLPPLALLCPSLWA